MDEILLIRCKTQNNQSYTCIDIMFDRHSSADFYIQVEDYIR